MNSDKEHLASTQPNGVPVERGTPETGELLDQIKYFNSGDYIDRLTKHVFNLERQRDASLQREKVLREALAKFANLDTADLGRMSINAWRDDFIRSAPEYIGYCREARAALGDK